METVWGVGGRMKEPDEDSLIYLLKESLLGGLGGIVAGIVITLFCIPVFGAVGIVFWLLMQL